SLATYWWPDPRNKNGSPYIRKDGHANPERLEITDFTYLKELCRYIRTLGYAYYFTNDKKYAEKADKFIQVWFINPETKMNPHLEFSQVIIGRNNGQGRVEGLIDTKDFVFMLEGIELMSRGLSRETQGVLKKWFSDYLYWLLNSEMGKKGKALKNNLGTTYYMQILAYCKFVGSSESKFLAKSLLQSDVQRLLASQFDSKGRQPLESTRTNSWNYSVSNLAYWFNIATVAEGMGGDLWRFKSGNIMVLQEGLKYLNENAFEKWKYRQESRSTSLYNSLSALNTI